MSHRIYAVFVQNVRDRMQDLGVNQKALARALEVTEGYVSQILNGRARPGLDSLEKFGIALSIHPSELLREPRGGLHSEMTKSA